MPQLQGAFTVPLDVETGHAPSEQGDSWRSVLGSLASRARSVGSEVAPRARELTVPLASLGASASSDEAAAGDQPRWAYWARQTAERVKQQAADVAGHAQQGLSQGLEKARSEWGDGPNGVQGTVSRSLERVTESASSASSALQGRLAQGVEKAKSVEWTEQAKGIQRSVSRGLEGVTAGAASASSSLQEKGHGAQQFAKEYSSRSLQSLSESNVLQSAKENASHAAGAARGALSVASDRVSGVATLAMSPAKLAQFFGIFFVGLLFIVMSLNFLPILILAPQKFALLFTIGSITMLSSFVVLGGARAFGSQLMQRDKLPFSIAYGVSLVGTLWATIIARSYIFTGIFAAVQAISLLYYLATFFPGGRSALNMIGRLAGRSVRTVVQM